jgi:hypothetical protein
MFMLHTLLQDDLGVIIIAAAAATALLLIYLQHKWTNKLDIPRIGKSPHRLFGLGIYVARADFMHHGRKLVEEGYKKVGYTYVVT